MIIRDYFYECFFDYFSDYVGLYAIYAFDYIPLFPENGNGADSDSRSNHGGMISCRMVRVCWISCGIGA
jgi:hypothetical protein